METQNVYLKLTLILVIAALMTACGASKGPAEDYSTSSRVNPSDTLNAAAGDRAFAYCNQTTSTASVFTIASSTYKDGETIAVDRINVKIIKIPAAFSQNNNYLEFQKYMVNSIGSTLWGDERLSFDIYSIADGRLLASNKKYLYWADLQDAVQKVGATTPEQFFKRVRMVVYLEDYAGEYDVIVGKYFDADDTLVSQVDSLIPIFDADPARYAFEKDGSTRHQDLQKLHPLKSFVGQGWTSQTYKAKVDEFCKPIYSVQ